MDPLDALYADIENLGDIFDVRDRADSLVAEYQSQIAVANATVPTGQEPARVFLYDSADPAPLLAGLDAIQQTVEGLIRNPNEELALQALFLRLPRLV